MCDAGKTRNYKAVAMAVIVLALWDVQRGARGASSETRACKAREFIQSDDLEYWSDMAGFGDGATYAMRMFARDPGAVKLPTMAAVIGSTGRTQDATT